jgi:hypothetical protein
MSMICDLADVCPLHPPFTLYPPHDIRRLEVMHNIYTKLLDPHHLDTIRQYLIGVHSTGRRSNVLDVGTVSDYQTSLLARYLKLPCP